MSGGVAVVTLEMSISEFEFLRILNGLLQPSEALHEVARSHWRLSPSGVDIHVCALAPLRAGALCLPRMKVRLDLSTLPDEATRTTFLRRFRNAFHRGGG